MAAITRTSTLIVRADPSRSTSCSCSTRSTLACVFGLMSPTSSRKIVPAIGLLELADLLLGGAGERALLVPEQLRLDQLLGNRRAVHLHEALPGARAVAVDGARNQLLADAALAEQQHGGIGRRGALDRLRALAAATALLPTISYRDSIASFSSRFSCAQLADLERPWRPSRARARS